MQCEAPHDYIRRAFPALRLHASGACSGCLIPLFAALRRLESLDLSACRDVVCGRGGGCKHIQNAIIIGTCAGRHTAEGPHLAQCPPTKEEVFEFLKEHLPEKGHPG
jgi:hypothetical protein